MHYRNLKAFLIAVSVLIGTLNIYAQESPTPSGIEAGASHRRVWIPISAFADAPIVNADVIVYNAAGKPLFEKRHATNTQGFFPAPVRKAPRNFRVTVTWDGLSHLGRLPLAGFTLSADVQNFDPDHDVVYVNPVTTLVSRVLEESKGQLTLEQAEARVRHFLGLPPYASLGIALRHGKDFRSRYFSQEAFLAEAAKYGGVRPFLRLLVSEMLAQPGIVHPFAPPAEPSLQGVFSFVAENLAKGALSWAAGQGCGWVTQSFGLTTPPDGATLDAIANLQQGLQDLQSSVKALSDQIAAMEQQILQKLNENEYYTVAQPARDTATLVDKYEQDLTYYAVGCSPLTDSSNVSAQSDPDYCTTQKQKVLSDLDKANGMYQTLRKKVLDDPTLALSGTIHLFSLSLGESTRFFRPAESTKVQNALEYWDAALTQAANLEVEQLHYGNAQDNVAGVQELVALLGDANANPPTDGLFQQTQAAELQAAFPVVPTGTVMDTKTRFMWRTDIPTDRNGCFNRWPYSASGYPYTDSTSFNGLSGWSSPFFVDLQTLVDGGGSDPMGWLIAQTKAVAPDSPASAGFPDIVSASAQFNTGGSCAGAPWVWSVDHAPAINGSPAYYLFDFQHGTKVSARTYAASNWLFLRRPLERNEQYYWYQ